MAFSLSVVGHLVQDDEKALIEDLKRVFSNYAQGISDFHFTSSVGSVSHSDIAGDKGIGAPVGPVTDIGAQQANAEAATSGSDLPPPPNNAMTGQPSPAVSGPVNTPPTGPTTEVSRSDA